MLHYLSKYNGELIINEHAYESIQSAVQDLKSYNGELIIHIPSKSVQANIQTSTPQENQTQQPQSEISTDIEYMIKVRKYMTQPGFEFHKKYNSDTPMPLRIMVGKIIKETPGMYKMELRGDILEDVSTHCYKCGRPLTNNVSKFLGIGPECGGHNYTNPFETEEELNQAVKEIRTQLNNTTWTGWVIKSSIEEMEIYNGKEEK